MAFMMMNSSWYTPATMDAILLSPTPWRVYDKSHFHSDGKGSQDPNLGEFHLRADKLCSSFGIVGLLVSTGHSHVGSYSVRVHKVLVHRDDWNELLKRRRAAQVQVPAASCEGQDEQSDGYEEDTEENEAVVDRRGESVGEAGGGGAYVNPLYSVRAAEGESENKKSAQVTDSSTSVSTGSSAGTRSLEAVGTTLSSETSSTQQNASHQANNRKAASGTKT